MTELDVEPVDSVDEAVAVDADADLPAGVEAPEYVLYGGKGGVGKTTCAAATALASAAAGTPTLVVSTDPAHSLSDTLETDVPPEPAQVREDVPLFAAEVDPDAAMEAGPLGGGGGGNGALGGLGGVGEALDDLPMDPLMGGEMPGADEAVAMQRLIEYLDDPRFDRVVVDTAPTGHTLRLLELPETLDSMVGRLLQFRERVGGMMDGLSGMFGDDEEGDVEPGPGLEEVRERIERLRTVLRDPERTDFRVVMVPEEMSVVESERLVGRLEEFEIPVRTLVVNRVMEPATDVAGGAIDEEWIVAPDLEDCEFCQRRWEVQQRALDRATDLFRGRTVKRVPLLADEVRGDAALRVVAACLS
ncbi:MAG: ArsA family ATPase [Haloferacaceae archaeon]